MNVKLVFKVLGHILRIESVFLLLPAMVALIYGESPLPFLVTALLLLGVGQGLCRLKTKARFFAREGFVAVGLIWFATCLFGALPFWLSGSFPSFVDCLFESVSGEVEGERPHHAGDQPDQAHGKEALPGVEMPGGGYSGQGQSQNGHQQDGQQEGGGVLLVQQGDRQRQEHEECLDQQDAAHQPGYQFQIHDMPPGAEKVCSPSS